MEKIDFLIIDFPVQLRKLDIATKPKWGKMNVQQMIDHMIDSVREANGKIPRTILTEQERLPAYKSFLMSEKEFKPETKNPLMPSEPLPERHPDKETAIKKLELELKDFVDHYTVNSDAIITNAIFGDLNYVEWTQLLHKHAVHHLKQFGVPI